MGMFRRLWKNTAISLKLPLVIAIPAVVLMLTAGTLVTYRAVKEFGDERIVAYQTLLTERASALENWLDEAVSEVNALSVNGIVELGIKDFGRGWMPVEGEEPGDYLRRLYITENPNPLGQKDELLAAEDKSVWTLRHKKYHEGFRAYQRARGLYDLFLFDPNGNLIYSVFKEDDFGTNFVDGPHKDSGLGEAFRAARDLEAGKTYMTGLSPYGPSHGAPAIFITAPVYSGMSLVGVVGVQVPVDRLTDILAQSGMLGKTGLVYTVDAHGNATSASPHEGGHKMFDQLPMTEAVVAAIADEDTYFENTTGIERPSVIAVTDGLIAPNGDRWGIVLEIGYAEATSNSAALVRNSLLTAAIVSLGILVFSWVAARTVTRRVHDLNVDMTAVAERQYNLEVKGTDYGDELGQITRTLEGFKGDLKAAEAAEEARVLRQKERDHVVATLNKGLIKLSEGDLTFEIKEAFPEEHESLREHFNTAVNRLQSLVNEVVEAVASIRNGAQEINRSSDDLSQRTEAQAATLEETAAALDELTASVKSSADGAQNVEGIVKEARTEAEASGAVVRNAVAAMTEIEKSSTQISRIISVIDDIAFQTNLLALNAGVEAARAGEAGRGFAVVASEVQSLAQRSADAANEIKGLINASGQHVGRGVDLVGKAGKALESIVERVTNISTLVSDIARGAAEQSTGIAEINTGMSQLDQVTQQNAAMVEEATAASQLLNNDANALGTLVQRFETGTGSGATPISKQGAAVAKPETRKAVAQPSAHGDEDWDDIAPVAVKAVSAGNAAKALWDDF